MGIKSGYVKGVYMICQKCGAKLKAEGHKDQLTSLVCPQYAQDKTHDACLVFDPEQQIAKDAV